MAVKNLEEVVSTLSAEEKLLFDKTLKANPELAGGWLRQDEFSRKMNELKTQQAEYEEGKQYTERMKVWADETVPKWEELVEKGYVDKETGNELFSTREAEYKRQLEAAQIGGDMDPAELDRRVKEIVKTAGISLTKDEINNLAKEEARKFAEEAFDTRYKETEKKFNENTIPYLAGFATSMSLAAGKYERETGEEFTDEKQREFFSEMSRTQVFDPRKAMETYLAPARAKKDTEAEVKRRVDEELAKRRMPGGGDEGYIPTNGDKGAVRRMMEATSADGDFESKIAAAAVAGAKELIAEGK